MKIFRTYQRELAPERRSGMKLTPGQDIIANDYEHAKVCVRMMGKGHLRISGMRVKEIELDNNSKVEWDDLIRPSKLQLN